MEKINLKQAAYINGQWVNADNKIAVNNPANNDIIGYVPDLEKDLVHQAINSAAEAFETWKNTSPDIRYNLLQKFYELIIRDREKLAKIITIENGKALQDARKEVDYGANFIRYFAGEPYRISGATLPSANINNRTQYIKQPIGVVGAITPWNFPMAMIARKLGPILAAGCTAVLKPSEFTPFSCNALIELLIEAGLPKGVVNVITGDAAMIGEIMTSHAQIKKITFTGSTRVGKIIYSNCANQIKKLALELGGNAPLIIFEDANQNLAIEGIIASKLRSGGQSCTSINRIFLHEKIYDQFIENFKIVFANVKLGDGLNEENDLGSVINQAAIDKYEYLIADALSKGAELVLGGKKLSGQGCFFEPTIIKNANPNMEIFSQEIFGPIAVFYKFSNDQEALALANKTNYGLASYLYTQSQLKARHISENLQYGMVGINETILANEMFPFTGIKESGIGVEGSHLAIDEFLNIKSINYRVS